jgi:cytochrome c oxidase subunit II
MTRVFREPTSVITVASRKDNSIPGVVVLINFQTNIRSEGQVVSVQKSSARKKLNFIFRVIGTTLLVILMCTSAAKSASPRRVEVVAKRFAFEPAEITLKKGEPVDFVLTSDDVAHGVRIRELSLDLHVGKGKTADETLTPSTTGTFVGHCSVFCGSGHGQMTLTIHVVG